MEEEKELHQDDVVLEDLTEEGEPQDPATALKTLRDKLKKCVAEKQEYLDGWQRSKADFINARKREEESRKEMISFANEGLILELIPVLESFEMAMGNKEAWEKIDKNWRLGVEYIANQLKKVLEDNGLKEIAPMGEKFDPMRDEAVEFEKVTDEAKNNSVTAIIKKGYALNGRVIKAPKVKVGEAEK